MKQRANELVAPLRYADFRRLWIAQALSEIGDWAARVSLAVLVYQRTENAGLSALVTVVALLPWVGIGQVLAPIGDRYARRTVMITSDLIRASLYLFMIIPQPTWSLLLLAFLSGCADPPFEAARSAALPHTVPKEHYGDGIALANMTYQVAILSGLVSGSVFTDFIGPRWGLTVNAATFVASALVIFGIKQGREPAHKKGDAPTARHGFRAFWDDQYVRRSMGMFSVIAGCGVAVEAQATGYVLDTLDSRPLAIAAIAAAVPVGTFLTMGLVRARGDAAHLYRLTALMAAVGAVLAVVTFLFRAPLPLAVIPFFGVGILFGAGAPANQICGTRIPDEVRASAFGFISGLLQGSQAAGAAIGALIAGLASPAAACIAATAAASAVAIWGLLRPLPAPLEAPVTPTAGAAAPSG